CTLRGGAASPPAAHRPAPRLPHDGGADVVACALPGPRAAAPLVRGADAVSVSAGDPDVSGGGAHHPCRPGALPLLRRGTARLRAAAARRSADRRADDVGARGLDLLAGDDGGVVPLVGERAGRGGRAYSPSSVLPRRRFMS